MEYFEIVWQGYRDKNNREHLLEYFIRKFKEAQEQQFDAEEFFSGCYKVIEEFENSVYDLLIREETRLKQNIVKGSAELLKLENEGGSEIQIQHCSEFIEQCKRQLSETKKDSFDVPLTSITDGRIQHNLPYSEFMKIKGAINEAYFKILVPQNDKFDLTTIKENLRSYTSITEKLDYWHSIKMEFIDAPFKPYESANTAKQIQISKKLTEFLFGTNCDLISPLYIPQNIYNEHFKNGLDDPEFTYWFLKYHAQIYFENIYTRELLDENLKTPETKLFIDAELNRLNDFNSKANDLFKNGKFDIHNPTPQEYRDYKKEIELIRIKSEYYNRHPFPGVHSVANTTVILFSEHVYLKKFLETKLQKVLPPNPEGQLSVSDWSMVFYYLDESGSQEGFKTDRFYDFIHDYNVRNPQGELTTVVSFKKEYHENINRINQKEGAKPLPPKRIEKILPLLQSNKKALERAKNDITYLEIERESKEN